MWRQVGKSVESVVALEQGNGLSYAGFKKLRKFGIKGIGLITLVDFSTPVVGP